MSIIPHSKGYSGSDIALSNDIYDIIICGSDQLWNPFYLISEFFVKPEKRSIPMQPASERITSFLKGLRVLMQKIKILQQFSCVKKHVWHYLTEKRHGARPDYAVG